MAAIGSVPLADREGLITAVVQEKFMFAFMIIFGLVSTVIPYLTYTMGLKYMENGKASILASVEPVVATLLGIVLFHESMTLTGVLGVVLVLVAISICQEKE